MKLLIALILFICGFAANAGQPRLAILTHSVRSCRALLSQSEALNEFASGADLTKLYQSTAPRLVHPDDEQAQVIAALVNQPELTSLRPLGDGRFAKPLAIDRPGGARVGALTIAPTASGQVEMKVSIPAMLGPAFSSSPILLSRLPGFGDEQFYAASVQVGPAGVRVYVRVRQAAGEVPHAVDVVAIDREDERDFEIDRGATARGPRGLGRPAAE